MNSRARYYRYLIDCIVNKGNPITSKMFCCPTAILAYESFKMALINTSTVLSSKLMLESSVDVSEFDNLSKEEIFDIARANAKNYIEEACKRTKTKISKKKGKKLNESVVLPFNEALFKYISTIALNEALLGQKNIQDLKSHQNEVIRKKIEEFVLCRNELIAIVHEARFEL